MHLDLSISRIGSARFLAPVLLGIGVLVPAHGQQQPHLLAPATSSASSTSVRGAAPVCSDPPLTCPAPSTSEAQLHSDRFGTLPGFCTQCVDPDGVNCFIDWDSQGTPPTAPKLRVEKLVLPPGVCSDLIQAEVTIRGSMCGRLLLENLQPASPCTRSLFQLGVDLVVTPPAGFGLPATVVVPVLYIPTPPTLAPFDGTVDFGGLSGITVDAPLTIEERCFRIVDPTILLAFLDSNPGDGIPEYLEFDHRTMGASGFCCCAPVDFRSRPFSGLEIDVDYLFCKNAPPVTAPDNAIVCRDGFVDIDVLGNDSDPENAFDCATLAIQTQPPHGTAVVMGCMGSGPTCPGCVIRYTPNPGYTGSDSFVYTIGDLPASITCPVTGTVGVEVCATEAQDDGNLRVCAGGSLDINVKRNDTTTCGSLDCRSVTITDQPDHGTATVNNGCMVNYAPAPGYSGPDSFQYQICNDQTPACCDTGTVSIQVCATVAQDDSARVCAGTSVSIPVTQNDSTDCGVLDCSTLAVVTPPAMGTATPNGCNIVYTAPAGFSGQVTFTYRVCNDQQRSCCDTATVTVDVCATDARNDSFIQVCQGGSIGIPVTNNDVTSCGTLDCSTITITDPPDHGQVSINGCTITYTQTQAGYVGRDSFDYRICNNQTPQCCDTARVSLTICAVTAQDDSVRVCAGSSVAIPVRANDATTCGALDCTSIQIVTPPSCGTAIPNGCNVVYTAPASCSGTITFEYRVCNDQEPECCDTALVSVEVCQTDARNDSFIQVCQGGTIGIPVTNNDVTSCGTIDCSTITITDPPDHGQVAISGCTVNYTQTEPGYSGPDSFQYRVCNNQSPQCCDTATVSLTVCTVAAIDDSARVCAGSSVTIPVRQNDGATCGNLDCATIAIQTAPSCGTAVPNGCDIVYTAPANCNGTVTFQYRICNDQTPQCCDVATVTVDVCRAAPVDDSGLEVCRGGSISIPVTTNDTTSCGALDCSTITITDPPDHGVATPNGCSITYQQTQAGYSGPDSFEYRVCNDQEPECCGTARVSLTVCDLIAQNDSAQVCVGDSVDVAVTGNDQSTCGQLDCGTLQIVTGPTCGSAQVVGCSLRYAATGDACVGTRTVVYRVSDGACSGTATLTIEVRPRPTAQDDKIQFFDGSTTPIVIDVLENDSGGAGCNLVPSTVLVTDPPSQGSALANADGTITYVPEADFEISDEFGYEVANDCGCRAEARVRVNELGAGCPTRNRRRPGSLLVYPEFDNRQANLTMFTLTNTNCNHATGSVRVELVYINSQNCLKNDFTIQMTACDTYTAITSFQNPNFQRGYIYAFAKNAQGRAISFNHLIGHLLLINGIDSLDYAVNPVVFKAVPTPDGAITDLDNDSIRDLDFVEYEEAPDRLLIPRFLGQDPNGSGLYHSELVLLNLSGGSRFTTIVDLMIFNDAEEGFSAARSFYCWDKLRLVDISGAFLNDFLQSTNDDPLEIIGDPTREAGWFWVDGNSASSTVEFITDPAVYGFLVERAIPYSVADLPWEECIQRNGDLLPMSIFGDGPDFVNGDNE